MGAQHGQGRRAVLMLVDAERIGIGPAQRRILQARPRIRARRRSPSDSTPSNCRPSSTINAMPVPVTSIAFRASR
jgi:hypothetical protein